MAIVDLPEPEPPTMAVKVPGLMHRLMSLRVMTSGREGYEKLRLWKTMSPMAFSLVLPRCSWESLGSWARRRSLDAVSLACPICGTYDRRALTLVMVKTSMATTWRRPGITAVPLSRARIVPT